MATAQEILTANALGKNIDRLMRNHKPEAITQDELASYVGIKRQSISNYIKGKTMPDAAVLQSIADYFNISTDDLLGRADEQHDDEMAFLLKCSEYTGLSVDAIKDFHTFPRMADTISNLCSTKNNLLDYIGRYLFPRKGMIPDDVEAELMTIDRETGIFHPWVGLTDLDDWPVLLVSNQGEFYLDRDSIEQMLIIQIVDALKRIKRGEVKKR